MMWASIAALGLLLVVAQSAAIGPDGSCGGPNGYICPSGYCCSQYNFCGPTEDYCGAGCQPAFGSCSAGGGSSAGSGSSGSSGGGSNNISPDSTCGGSTGYTCTGSTFGSCCSKWGYCGNTNDYCGNGCQATFGSCTVGNGGGSGSGSGSGSSSGGSSNLSPDASCGEANGYTCAGTNFGQCCSQWGFCGSTNDYCGQGCQSAFGTCT